MTPALLEFLTAALSHGDIEVHIYLTKVGRHLRLTLRKGDAKIDWTTTERLIGSTVAPGQIAHSEIETMRRRMGEHFFR